MKTHYVSVLIAAGLFAAVPAHAAMTVIGQGPSVVCFNAAAKVSRTSEALPEILNNSAIANCNEALTDKLMVQDRVATLVNRGTLEAAAMDTDAALSDYDAALALRPQLADVYIDRGSALLRAPRYDEARANFDKALTLGTKSAHIAYFDRGIAEEKAGNISDAYRDYKQALALSPDFQVARVELSRFHVQEQVAAR